MDGKNEQNIAFNDTTNTSGNLVSYLPVDSSFSVYDLYRVRRFVEQIFASLIVFFFPSFFMCFNVKIAYTLQTVQLKM